MGAFGHFAAFSSANSMAESCHLERDDKSVPHRRIRHEHHERTFFQAAGNLGRKLENFRNY
jgi:hypothetical protein